MSKEGRGIVDCRIAADGVMNSFCASLRERDRAELCKHCTLRKVPRGAPMFKEDMQTSIFILLEGFLVGDVAFSEKEYFLGHRPGLGILTAGDVFSCDLVFSPTVPDEYEYYLKHSDNNSVAFVDCTMARFPLGAVKDLCAKSIDFLGKLFQINIEMFGLTCEFASALRGGSVESSVRYLLCFEAERGLELTHEQIASLCRRNRTTVSKILADLPRSDPEFMAGLQELRNKRLK